jgi:hypothetical protein
MIKSKDFAKVIQESVNIKVRSSKRKAAASKGVAIQEWDANCPVVTETNKRMVSSVIHKAAQRHVDNRRVERIDTTKDVS